MGSIISSKVRDDRKIIFEICVDQEEALQLKGLVDNIYLLSDNAEQIETNVVQRGKNEATMYFLIPKNMRSKLKNTSKAKFQKIDSKDKTMYVYTVKNE
ncbi:hypothetical protein GOV04_03250 [Candidatus Woesearchaeota archaeon]|nr:hypothetical protein [Candidatus Woesearchaeota archaeon]